MVQKSPIEGQNGNNISNMHPLQVTGSYFKNMLLDVLSQSTSFEQNHLNGILQDGFRDLERWLEKESPSDFETDCINNLRIALENGVTLLKSPKINIDDVYKIEARVEQYCHSLNERIEVFPELITLESISFISNNKYLNEKITQAQSLTQFHYTVDSWNTLQTALNSAITLINNSNATQIQIDTAVINLQNAKNKLVSIQTLNNVISAAPTNSSLYTPASWAVFQTALTIAYTVKNNSNATQAEVNTTITNLQNAINELKLVGNKAALTNLITIVNGLTQAHYTSESWSALQTELTSAINIINLLNATQIQIDTAITNLQNAKNKLVSIQTLNNVISAAPTNSSLYTPASWSALQTAKDAAILIRDKANATQIEINTAITNLQNAINNLKLYERGQS